MTLNHILEPDPKLIATALLDVTNRSFRTEPDSTSLPPLRLTHPSRRPNTPLEVTQKGPFPILFHSHPPTVTRRANTSPRWPRSCRSTEPRQLSWGHYELLSRPGSSVPSAANISAWYVLKKTFRLYPRDRAARRRSCFRSTFPQALSFAKRFR